MSRLDEAFRQARAQGRAAFIPYLTAGFPDPDGFLELARDLLEVADVLEVGLPYSDPLGDGPTIQRSSERALKQGVSTETTMALIKELRRNSDRPIVCMTYYNPIYCCKGGERGFLEALKRSGADGVILPDLPPDEAGTLIGIARELAVDTIFLIAPTTTEARLKLVTEACRGFVYAVSVTGVTGARETLPEDVVDLVARARAASPLPVAVGFGIASARTAKAVAEVADGVVVGSALVTAAERGGARELATELAAACLRPRNRQGAT